MPRLRVRAGPSLDELTEVPVNSGKAVDVSSDVFEGKVAVYLKGFADPTGEISDSNYFEQDERKGVTWSIQMQGRYLKEYSADDILFGNIFDTPIYQPWGFSAAVRFMQYLDPTLEQDLASQSRPWALSPLISSMPYLQHARIEGTDLPAFPPEKPVGNDTSLLNTEGDRRRWFADAQRRKDVTLGPRDLLQTDFCYNYISFSPSSVYVSLPGGFSVDLTRYWDGEPVKFVCCKRGKEGDDLPWGRVFWCVAIERVEEREESKKAEERKEGEESKDPERGESAGNAEGTSGE